MANYQNDIKRKQGNVEILLNSNKELCVHVYEMDGNCQAMSSGKYQEIGCSLSFDLLAKYAMGLSALATFKISVNQTATQSFPDPPISRNPFTPSRAL